MKVIVPFLLLISAIFAQDVWPEECTGKIIGPLALAIDASVLEFKEKSHVGSKNIAKLVKTWRLFSNNCIGHKFLRPGYMCPLTAEMLENRILTVVGDVRQEKFEVNQFKADLLTLIASFTMFKMSCFPDAA